MSRHEHILFFRQMCLYVNKSIKSVVCWSNVAASAWQNINNCSADRI